MKLIKVIGLISLICFTFFYTEKIIDVSLMQDEIMIEINNNQEKLNKQPINAKIENDTIIPGKVGYEIDLNKSYKSMKKIGYYEESLLVYKNIYPETSIYNNYNKYLLSGSPYHKNISIIYIIKNDTSYKNILRIINNPNTNITFFIDSTYLNNNISIIETLSNYEIYNYGNNGTYTKDNLIITNNIINNKSHNTSNICLFTKKDTTSLDNCTNASMHSLIPSINGTYQDIKNNLSNGSVILLNNYQELPLIINYITSKGYNILPLSKVIIE